MVVNEISSAASIVTLSPALKSKLPAVAVIEIASDAVPSVLVNEIFSLPRSEEGSAYGSSLTQNGDYLLYRLDSVREGKASMEEVALEQVNSFLSQQESLSELSKFQTQLQKEIKVERFN